MTSFFNQLIALGLLIGVLFGLSGMAFTEPETQLTLFTISGVGLSSGMALLALKQSRAGQEMASVGAMIFAIAEAILTLTGGMERASADFAFASCMLFYFVGLLLLQSSRIIPSWTRITATLSAIAFLAASVRFFLGYGISSADTLPGLGYGMLSLTSFGWVWWLVRERANPPELAGE